MSPHASRFAVTDHPVLDVITERWSTRVFDPAAELDESAFASALEAARWAPSAANTQPWRAIVARRGTPEHAAIVSSLAGFNGAWAPDAAALVVFLAESVTETGDPMRWGVYDTGQAAAFFTIQAHAGGLATHQMGGFDPAAVSAAFDVDPRFTPISVIAVGTFGDAAHASDEIRECEATPRTRRPLEESLLVDA